LNTEIHQRALVARSAVAQAGQLAWEHFQRGVAVELKADRTPVTVADRQVEDLLRSTLGSHFANDGFFGEEFGDHQGATGFRWIIDPIDATKNFIRGIPLFATLVGLERDGVMVAGFASVPAFAALYHAVRGAGAYKNDRPIRVSTVNRLDQAYLSYSSLEYFDRTGMTAAYLDVVRQVAWSRGFGDFYGHLLVADGSIDAMIEPVIRPWDIAALKPIVEEAGGRMTDWFGNDTIYGQGCITTNTALHGAIVDRINRTQSHE
jgi:histidinol phosphatase-like enzyme (inositol monophosphatase family)